MSRCRLDGCENKNTKVGDAELIRLISEKIKETLAWIRDKEKKDE